MEKKKLAEKFDDIISEKEVIEKFNLSKSTLQKMRREGQIKNWGTFNGRKLVYSKAELVQLSMMDKKAS